VSQRSRGRRNRGFPKRSRVGSGFVGLCAGSRPTPKRALLFAKLSTAHPKGASLSPFVSSARYLAMASPLTSHFVLFSDHASVSFGAIGHSGGLTACSTWRDVPIKTGLSSWTTPSNVHVSSPGKRFALSSLTIFDCSHLTLRLIYLIYSHPIPFEIYFVPHI
jgi:hypothetical protein